MYIDTHAHLGDPRLLNLSDITTAFPSDIIQAVIAIGCSHNEIISVLNLSKKYPQIYSAIGIYPLYNKDENEGLSDTELFQQILENISNPKVVAVGECGIDLSTPPPWESQRELSTQLELFEKQIDLGIQHNLPIIIHSRKSQKETLNVLKQYSSKIKFVWHCFSEDASVAEEVLSLGGYLSFTGIVTYKNVADIHKAIEITPLEKIMVESDSPYLIPEPERSLKTNGETKTKTKKINMPRYVTIIASKIAEIKNVDPKEVEQKTTSNAIQFFNLNTHL